MIIEKQQQTIEELSTKLDKIFSENPYSQVKSPAKAVQLVVKYEHMFQILAHWSSYNLDRLMNEWGMNPTK